MDDDGQVRGARGRTAGRYAAELVVVFVGVWLSFLAEDWRQQAGDSRTEQASLIRMTEDLQADSADLRLNLERALVGVRAGDWVLERGLDAVQAGDSLRHALSAVQFCSFFVENPAEYEALRNSGNLGIVADAELRRSIVVLYESRLFLRSLHARDCEHNENVFALMAPHVTAVPPSSVVELGAFGVVNVAPEEESDWSDFPDGSRPRVLSVPGARELVVDSEFRTRLTELVGHRRFLAFHIETQMGNATALRKELISRVR